jgi:hypothetical protein
MNHQNYFQKEHFRLLISVSLATVLVFFGGYHPARADNVVTSGTTMTVVGGTSVVSPESIVINSGGALNNFGTIILRKNLTNGNTAPNSLGSGTIVFSGTTTQTVTGENIIQNMTVNNSAGITVTGNTQVNGTLLLTTGKVSLGSKNLLLGPSASISGTPSSVAMIIVTGLGELRKQFPEGFTGSFVFPVGDDTDTPEYSPVTLNFSGGTFASGNYAGVSLVNAKYPDHEITGNYLNRYWSISQSGITGFICNASFQYLPSDVSGTEELLSCTKVNPLPWVTNGLTNTTLHQLTAAGITSFGAFTGLNSSTPPVNQELANITIPNGVTNCYDATQILTVAGNGNTFIVENNGSVTLVAGYKISILPGAKVYPGGYLYAHITTDGNYCGSSKNPLVANPANEDALGFETIDMNHLIKVYPNPTADIVIVELLGSDATNTSNITVYSMQGSKLLQKSFNGESKFQFSLSGKPIGMYMVQVQSGNRSEMAKIIKSN